MLMRQVTAEKYGNNSRSLNFKWREKKVQKCKGKQQQQQQNYAA